MIYKLAVPVVDPNHGSLDAVQVSALVHDFERSALVICYREGRDLPEGFEGVNLKEVRYEDFPAEVNGLTGQETKPAVTAYTDFLAAKKLDLENIEPDGSDTIYTLLKNEGAITEGIIK